MGMAAIIIKRPGPFVQIFNPPLTKGSISSLKKIGAGVSEKSFKRMDGRQWITIPHPEPSAQVT